MRLPFRIEWRDNGAGYPVPWLVHDSGVRRRASDEEAALWTALEEALLAQTSVPGEVHPANRPAPPVRRKTT